MRARLKKWLLPSLRLTFRVLLLCIDTVGAALRGRLANLGPPASSPPPGLAAGGISVIIPERANEVLLAECLEAAAAACRQCGAPSEIIVVVNGAEPGCYAALQQRYPSVRWLFFPEPIWFDGAVREGIRVARYDWVYLLNSDMVLDSAALHEAARWRHPRVFAIASQIFFHDATRRREETGWTNYRIQRGLVEIFDQLPEDTHTVRGTFYAGGGASLFQKAVLVRLLGRGPSYEPFYWEDVEWGVRAWRLGYESLFCPASKALHRHRATNLKFFSPAEIDRVFRRNGCLFQLRNRLPGASKAALFDAIVQLDRKSKLELLEPRRLAGALAARLRGQLLPFDGLSLPFLVHKFYLQPPVAVREKPVILFVSPYRLYPPAHGGAMRMHHLIRHLSERFSIVLLCDEVDAYSAASRPYFESLASAHLVGGRTEEHTGDRIARIRNHSHGVLEEQLRMLAVTYAPSAVQIEFVELSALARARDGGTPWFLTLHDVLLSENRDGYTAADRFELEAIRKYDRVFACGEEDARLVPTHSVSLIPNGVELTAEPYLPSTGRRLLFLGPFRYSPNFFGIQTFLREVYPALKTAIPELELWVLGGDRARQRAAGLPPFNQEGVTVFDFVEDTRSMLDACTLTINPLAGVRGSCLKVIESLAAGRMCVSTRDGARGFVDSGFPALVIADRIPDLAAPITALLLDSANRLSLEHTPLEVLDQFTWARSAQMLEESYLHFVLGAQAGRPTSRPHSALPPGARASRLASRPHPSSATPSRAAVPAVREPGCTTSPGTSPGTSPHGNQTHGHLFGRFS